MIRNRRIEFIFLIALSAAVLLPILRSNVIHHERELRVVLTARDMAEGGSWIVPHYRGQPRLRKPPLMYWAVATSFILAGNTHSLWAARIPSVIIGFGMITAIYVFGRILVGRRRAFIAAILTPVIFVFIRQSMVAETDVAFNIFILITACSGFVAINKKQNWHWWLISGISAGLGFMTKGPVAVILPFLAWASYVVSKPSLFKNISWKHVIIGLLALICISLPWYVAVTFFSVSSDATKLQLQSEMSELLVKSRHTGPFYYYVYTLMHAFLPWSILLPPSLFYVLKRGWHHRGTRFLALWFLSSFTAMSLISSKQFHYSTILIAPSVLLIAHFIGAAPEKLKNLRGKFIYGVFYLLLTIGFFTGLALILAPIWKPHLPGTACRLAGFSILIITLAGFHPGMSIKSKILAFSFAISVFLGLYNIRLERFLEKDAIIPDIFIRNEALLSKAPHVFASGTKGSIFDFFSNVPIEHRFTPETAWEHARPGDIVVLAIDQHRPPLSEEWKNRKLIDSISRGDLSIQFYLRE